MEDSQKIAYNFGIPMLIICRPPLVLEHNYPLKLISEEQYRELYKNGALKNNRICNEILNEDPPNDINDDF